MREIADFLGDKLSTVEKNYYHHSPDYLRGAADWRAREQRAGDDRTNGRAWRRSGTDNQQPHTSLI